MRVLVACKFSGIVRDAFTAKGHHAVSCDFIPSERPGYHLQCDVLTIIEKEWDLMIAHPPCTYLSRSGYHWCNAPDSAPGQMPLKGQPRIDAMKDAAKFFYQLLTAPIKRICVENPIPTTKAGLPYFVQSIQPWQFGHPELKETCLWLKELPLLHPTKIMDRAEAVVHRAPPGPDRWMDRSRSYPGIAEAMAEQWGNL